MKWEYCKRFTEDLNLVDENNSNTVYGFISPCDKLFIAHVNRFIVNDMHKIPKDAAYPTLDEAKTHIMTYVGMLKLKGEL